jgi:hyperosmotically inducible protein
MKRFLIAFVLGLGVGAAGYWYVDNHRSEVWRAKQRVAQQAEDAANSIKQKVGEITVGDIMEELSRTGTVIREKAKKAGDVVADATSDARLTAAIKAKLLAEPGLSSFAINVDTHENLVTLSGAVSSPEQVARAVNIAYNTEGVRKVVSTLQVKAAAH